MTTVPPFDSTSVSLLLGSAATCGGATMLGSGGPTTGAGLAAISANAASGSAYRNLVDIDLPGNADPPSAAARLTPALMTAIQVLADILGDPRRDEIVDRTAVAGDFLDQLGCDRLKRHVGHQEDGLDLVVELLVHAGHLELIFEIGDGTQAAQDRFRALGLGEIHQQR